jgi:hypothetical protein
LLEFLISSSSTFNFTSASIGLNIYFLTNRFKVKFIGVGTFVPGKLLV